ncbi:MAG: hypothetical protein LBT99_00930 [Bifidobacteriaceae bacterium]|jgi:phosphoribosylformylglycinamidine (FGAM) synthase-like enzyme|nr:hypothetical protein [Bifidobacteriaceae bacterium]
MALKPPLKYQYQSTRSLLLSDFTKSQGQKLITDLKKTITQAKTQQFFKKTKYSKRYNLCLSLNNSPDFFKLEPRDGLIINITNCYFDLLCQGIKPIAFSTKINNFIDEGDIDENYYQIQSYKNGIKYIENNLKIIPISPKDKSLPKNSWIMASLGIQDTLNPFVNSKKAKKDEYIVLFGKTEPEFDGSIWASTQKKIKLGGLPPATRENQISQTAGLIKAVLLYHKSISTYSIGSGGLITALYKIAKLSNLGLKIDLSNLVNRYLSIFDILLSESTNRFLACINHDLLTDLSIICSGSKIPFTIIGKTTSNLKNSIEINNLGTCRIDNL